MKAIVISSLLSSIVAWANPLPLGDWAYISSESLEVSLETDAASIVGTFTFRSATADGKMDKSTTGDIQIPIWVPEAKLATEALRRILEDSPREQLNQVLDHLRVSWDATFAISIVAGGEKIDPYGYTVHDYPKRGSRDAGHPAFQRKGYSCIVVNVSLPHHLIAGEKPVKISYHQPLFKGRDISEFYYLPVIGVGPKADADKAGEYTMKITNPSRPSVSLGGATIPQGRWAILPLAHMEPVVVQTTIVER